MNIISKLKTLPIVGALAIGLALSPALSMADNGNHGSHKKQYSQNTGKSHDKHYRADKHKEPRKIVHSYDKRGHKKASRSHYGKPYGHDKGHVHYKRDKHRHNHNHRGHSHTHYVVNDYGYRDHFIDFDDLRFMIGLNTNNVDIIVRD
jgi:hypothetical protein